MTIFTQSLRSSAKAGAPAVIVTDPRNFDLSQYVRAGDHIIWGQACAEPTTLIEALIAQADDIGSISAFTATSFSRLLDENAGRKIKLSSMGAIGTLRSLTKAHLLDIIPCHFGQIGTMIAQGMIGCDVVFVQVSPADDQGNHSFGLVNDYIHDAVAKARVVIAEVNDQVPFTYGEAYLPAAKIDCALHVSRPPVEVAAAPISDNDVAIAKFASDYIGDGAVIQTGVGALPDAILRMLHDRRDLGIHSGMVGDGMVDLVEAGVVTNARKEIDPGISVAGVLVGTRRLYEFAHLNPKLMMRHLAYTHGESILLQLSQLVTINSAIEIDLTGQVNAEQSGSAYMGGTGGQVDFVRAGSRSRGGRSIIALPSTAKGGTISRIAATLSGPITTARSEVDVIVTEFGAAELKGQSLVERTRRLVAIAHPNFQEALDRAAHVIRQQGF